MTDNALPTVDTLRQLILYDTENGNLYWRERSADWFEDGDRSKEWRANNWNARFSGRLAGYEAPHGYCLVQLPGRMECAHRIAWAVTHGEWPEFIDHIDGNRMNNRLSNLRSVTRTDNNRNMSQSKANTSGVTGVWWAKGEGKWVAEISHNSKKVSLGRFATLAEATKARKDAETLYGYHANHGRAKHAA